MPARQAASTPSRGRRREPVGGGNVGPATPGTARRGGPSRVVLVIGLPPLASPRGTCCRGAALRSAGPPSPAVASRAWPAPLRRCLLWHLLPLTSLRWASGGACPLVRTAGIGTFPHLLPPRSSVDLRPVSALSLQQREGPATPSALLGLLLVSAGLV